MQRKIKAKSIKMLLSMAASVFLGNMGVIGCTSKVIVPISHILNHHNLRYLCTLVMFSHTTRKLFATFDTYMCRYNVIWPSQGIHMLMYAH